MTRYLILVGYLALAALAVYGAASLGQALVMGLRVLP